jgi:D-alanine transaminase
MSLIWINSEILQKRDAKIAVDDRGYQFADGVYEVIRVYAGRPFTLAEHLKRLERSAAGVQIPLPLGTADLEVEIRQFIEKQVPKDGMIYVQLTRGQAERNHVFPDIVKPTLLFYAMPLEPLPPVGYGPGLKVMPVPDERWKRCNIKSIALLANVLAKNQAISSGCDDAVFIDDGYVTEASAANFYAVIDGKVVTPPLGPKILPGITREKLLELDPSIIQRPVAEAEVAGATELFLTSSTKEIMWVSKWADRVISDAIGPVTRKLHEAFRESVLRP